MLAPCARGVVIPPGEKKKRQNQFCGLLPDDNFGRVSNARRYRAEADNRYIYKLLRRNRARILLRVVREDNRDSAPLTPRFLS